MIKLLKNADVYAPQHIGMKDVLIAGEKIFAIEDKIDITGVPGLEVLDIEGKKLLPGYIDLHVHITGGGGEQGPASRVPESYLTAFTSSGITTVLGLLGTDGITRSLENLVTKARALTEEGITAYCLTSSYGYPPVTMTESVEKDIMMIDPIVGVKLAVSDHRSNNPTGEDIIRLATGARRGGLLSGKAGLVTMHMGPGEKGLEPVFYALDHCDVPIRNLLPTHMGRNRMLLDQGVELVRRGGYMDITAGSHDDAVDKGADHFLYVLGKEGVTADHVTMSSDAFGSQPKFDDKGECIGLSYASPEFLHKTIKSLVKKGLPFEEAIKLLTSTPAHMLAKDGVKGCVAVGADADLLVLDDSLEIRSLIARGKTAVWEGSLLIKGRFE